MQSAVLEPTGGPSPAGCWGFGPSAMSLLGGAGQAFLFLALTLRIRACNGGERRAAFAGKCQHVSHHCPTLRGLCCVLDDSGWSMKDAWACPRCGCWQQLGTAGKVWARRARHLPTWTPPTLTCGPRRSCCKHCKAHRTSNCSRGFRRGFRAQRQPLEKPRSCRPHQRHRRTRPNSPSPPLHRQSRTIFLARP